MPEFQHRKAPAFHLRLILFSALACAVSTISHADNREIAVALLDFRAPAPDWTAHMRERIAKGEAMPPLPAATRLVPPPDSAPAPVHVQFVSEYGYRISGEDLTPSAREKLLQAALDSPALLPSVFSFVPDTNEAAEKVAEIFPELLSGIEGMEEIRRRILAWIYQRTGLLREQVITEAYQADWNDYRFGRSDEILAAIKDREANLAAEIFEQFAAGDDDALRVVGNLELYLTAMSTKEVKSDDTVAARYHAALIDIAADSKIHEGLRQLAVCQLLDPERPWQGVDEWTAAHLQLENPPWTNWIPGPLHRRADHWIPLLASWLNGPNVHAHNNAARLLAEFEGEHARPDALQPLLPWIRDPMWADDRSSSRLAAIRSLEQVEVPGTVPALLDAIRVDVGFELASAAGTLAQHQAKQAVPLLKAALQRERQMYQVHQVVDAIFALDGFTNQEIGTAMQAYADAMARPEIRSKIERAYWSSESDPGYPPAITLGQSLSKRLQHDEQVRSASLAHYRDLEKTDPAAADSFGDILIKEPKFEAAWDIIAERIEAGTLNAELLYAALLEQHPHPRFLALADQPGATAGLAATLHGNFDGNDLLAQILARENDDNAKLAVLAAARLTRDHLPLPRVAELLDAEDAALRQAAKLFLLDKNSAQSRKLLADHRRRTPAKHSEVGGSRTGYDPGHFTFRHFDDLQSELQGSIGSPQGPDEIFGLLSSGTWGGHGHFLVIVKDGRATAHRNFERGRSGSAELSSEQFAKFRHYLQTYRIVDLPPLELPIDDGIQYEFVHATADGAQRVFMNNPPTSREGIEEYAQEYEGGSGIVLYGELVNLFYRLFEKLDLKLKYSDQIEILLPREITEVGNVWKQGDDLRVKITQPSQRGSYWMSVEDGGPAEMVNAPAPFGPYPARELLPNGFDPPHHFRFPWQVRRGDVAVHSGDLLDNSGLWLLRKDTAPRLLIDAGTMHEVVSSDGRWCVVAKSGGRGWANPNTMVRINLESGEEFPLPLAAADNAHPICWLDDHQRFLLVRSRGWHNSDAEPGTGPEKPEYHLLDAETGELELVHGEFGPLTDQRERPLQPTADDKAGTFWATVVDTQNDGTPITRVGRYDAKHFSFENLVSIEGLFLSSMNIWVDENEAAIYGAINGDLIRLKLPAENKNAGR